MPVHHVTEANGNVVEAHVTHMGFYHIPIGLYIQDFPVLHTNVSAYPMVSHVLPV